MSVRLHLPILAIIRRNLDGVHARVSLKGKIA